MSVYAVDFDGTLCTNAYPEIGEPKQDIISFCKSLKRDNHKLIFNSCREGELMARAIVWCADRGLHFDAINANLPELIARYGGDCRKISADFYIDDKSLFLEGVNT